MYNPFQLTNKTILITGASSGIGRATAIECSKMGAKIIACGRNVERLDSTISCLEGSGHRKFVGDLVDSNVIEELVSFIDSIDGAFFAASQTMVLPIVFSSEVKFKEIYCNNLFPNIELLRLLIKKKKVREHGSIVYVVSIGGTTVFESGLAAYGSAKAALNSFIRYAALEFAPKKIRVNGISPGAVDTPMIHEGNVSDDDLADCISRCPLKRWGQPEDVARGAVYLLSDASSWVTGHTLVIDGGVSAR